MSRISRWTLRILLTSMLLVTTSSSTGGQDFPTPTPVPPESKTYAIGSTVVVNDANVTMHVAPSTGSPVVATLAEGTTLTVIAPAQADRGFVWWPVEDPATGAIGLVRAEFLTAGGAPSGTAATPVPGDAAGGPPAVLAEMLGLLPEGFNQGGERPGLDVVFAAPALQLEALGLPSPSTAARAANGDGRSITARSLLGLSEIWWGTDYTATPDGAQRYREALGFDGSEIDYAIGGGPFEAHLALFRGRFDAEAIRNALTRSGYRWVEEHGIPVARYGEDGKVDFSSDMGMLLVESAAYNVAFLPDGTLAIASSIALLRSVLDVAANGAPSLAGRSDVQMLLRGLPADLVAVDLFDGAMLGDPCAEHELANNPNVPPELREQIRTEIAAALERHGPLPPVRLTALGVTAGGPISDPADGNLVHEPAWPAARTVIALLFDSEAEAAAATSLVLAKLESGISFSTRTAWVERFPERTGRVVEGVPVAAFELSPVAGYPAPWLDLHNANDLAFLWFSTGNQDCST